MLWLNATEFLLNVFEEVARIKKHTIEVKAGEV